jgi:hypothetical protein
MQLQPVFLSRLAPAARANMRMSDRLQALHAVFAKGDADSNGQLTYGEFVAGIRPLVGTLDPSEEVFLFAAFDFTKDGKIDLAEFDYTLFRDVQVFGDSFGDAASVKRALADLILRKLAAFRALAPGEHGNQGKAGVDDNIVEVQQTAVKREQARGQGAAVATAQVFGSVAGIVSSLSIAVFVGGIVAAIMTETPAFFIVAGVAYAFHFGASVCCGHDFGLLSNAVSGAAGLVARFDPVYRANAAFRWHIECYHYETRTYTTTDSKGHRHTHTKRVRVTTHVATHEGRLRSFEVSPPFIPDVNSYALTQLLSTARVQVKFAEYFAARDSWRAANTRDAHQDFSAAELVPELQPEILVEYVPGLRPMWMTQFVYLVSTALFSALCAWRRARAHGRSGHLILDPPTPSVPFLRSLHAFRLQGNVQLTLRTATLRIR